MTNPPGMRRTFKYPKTIPEVVPYRKEATGDKLPNSYWYTEVLQPQQDEIVQNEVIKPGVDNVSERNVGSLAGFAARKYPVAFQNKVNGQPHAVTQKIGPPQPNYRGEQYDNKVAAPKPGTTANQILSDLDECAPLAFFEMLLFAFSFHA